MDREAGIAAYEALITADDYKRRRHRGETGPWDHHYRVDGDSPVVQVSVSEVDQLTDKITRYVLRAADGADLPPWEAGAHIDIVITPDMLRQYSLCGDPADRSCYQIAVLREDQGTGGSLMLHRVFRPGRRVFVSRPINHFPVSREAGRHYLMGGGIGVTPMIAMAHALHAAGAPFALHYSVSRRAEAAFAEVIAAAPWAGCAHMHVSDEGNRAQLKDILAEYHAGDHVYTCGPEPYMAAVLKAAEECGYPEEARHLEYFSVPDVPDYENHPFIIALRDGRRIEVQAETSAADALIAAGVPVDLKCSDGLCGVCKCTVLSGEVEHRDFVLSAAQRKSEMILCQSRAAEPGGVLTVDK
jgi:ferredoxin-NADP reductase